MENNNEYVNDLYYTYWLNVKFCKILHTYLCIYFKFIILKPNKVYNNILWNFDL